MNTLQAKCDFIEKNADEPWVLRKITYVACSVNIFPKEKLKYLKIVKVFREGLNYKKATSE